MSSVSPAAPAAPSSKSVATTTDWIGGILISVIFPIVGLIVGIYYMTKGGTKKTVGTTCVVLSIAMAVVWAAVSLG
jgi:hypothetical protein